MLKLSASAVALTLGLLVASAIMATQTARAEPYAQMNRPLYPTLKVAGHPRVPVHSARKPRAGHVPAVVPVVQMNRVPCHR